VQTHRHLVLVTDCWLRRMAKGIAHPYHPWGGRSWLTSPRRWGIDPDADPSLDQLLDLGRERMDEVREVIAGATAEDLERHRVPPNGSGHTRGKITRCCSACMWSSRRSAAPSVHGPGPRGARRAAPLIARRGEGPGAVGLE
jgi:DinB superfamily